MRDNDIYGMLDVVIKVVTSSSFNSKWSHKLQLRQNASEWKNEKFSCDVLKDKTLKLNRNKL